MKEQDAAHSDEQKIYIDGDFSDSYEARIKRATGKNVIISKVELSEMKDELTRLRSELQQKDEKIKECIKTIMKLEDDVNYLKIEELSPLRSELQQNYEKNSELNDFLEWFYIEQFGYNDIGAKKSIVQDLIRYRREKAKLNN